MPEETKQSQKQASPMDSLRSFLTKTNTFFALATAGLLIFLSSFMVWHKAEVDTKYYDADESYTGLSLNKNQFDTTDVNDCDGNDDCEETVKKQDFGGISSLFGGFMTLLAGALIVAGSLNVLYQFLKDKNANYLNLGIYAGAIISILVVLMQIVFMKGSFPQIEDWNKIKDDANFSFGPGLYLLILGTILATGLVFYAYKNNFLAKPDVSSLKADLSKAGSFAKEKMNQAKETAEKNVQKEETSEKSENQNPEQK